MGHFYDRHGKPCYTVLDAKGKERDATLRDCKKYGWVPSVSEVLNIIDKPALNNWKIMQGILASLTCSRNRNESDDAWIERIQKDSRAQAEQAATMGSAIHDAIDKSFSGITPMPEHVPHVDAVRDLLASLYPEIQDWVSEHSFAHPDGFGGRVDLYSPSKGIIVDYKGKDGDFSDGKKLAYDQFWQLGGYQYGLGFARAHNQGCNIFFSRTHPGKVTHVIWESNDMALGAEIFKAALMLWKLLKSYDGSFHAPSLTLPDAGF